MRMFENDGDGGTLVLAIITMLLVIGSFLYLYNGSGGSFQTASREPITIGKTVPTIVPSELQ